MREHPGDLLHVDVLKLGRIPDGGGWRVHGRKATVGRRHKPVVIDFDYVHVAIGDHSQRAYLEVSDDERVDACASFLRRAVAPLRQHEFVPNPLSGVDVKLRRAAVHLGVIHAAANDFVHIELARDPERHTIEEDPNDPSWTLLRWSNVPAIDPLLGAVLGDYVHNVRSALDQLAYSLVKLNGEEPGRHTFWPIFEAQDQRRTNITNRKATRGPAPTAGASEEAHNLVERWQPFQRGDSSWDCCTSR